LTHALKNLPSPNPANRGTPLGVFSLPEAGKGRLGGILEIDVVTILRLLIIPCSPLIEKERIL
jgi:hypothetical protein